MTLTGADLLHVALHLGEAGLIFVLVRDLLKLTARVDALEVDEHALEAVEHKHHDETAQLRQEVDAVAQKIRAKVARERPKHAPRPLVETLEGAAPRPLQPDETRVWSPNEPKLPRWTSCPACGLQSEQCICGGP